MKSLYAAVFAVVSFSATAAETRPTPLLPADAFCRQMGKMVVKPDQVGVTEVRCDEQGRPGIVSGRAPTGEIYRLEYLYGRSGPAEQMRVNGGEVVSLLPLPDAASALERMKEAQTRGQAQRMEMCPTGEVVNAGTACAEPQTAQQSKVYSSTACIMFGENCEGGDNEWSGTIQQMTIRESDAWDRYNTRQLLLCFAARDVHMSDCARQYGVASLTCKPFMFFGLAAEFACEIGMAMMNQYCTSLAPTC